ncbi:MAG TPA: tRNA (adenosine(37)-N6)-dimethylallyltransferase MiaA [Candidatus Deferrimicrobium sp.]|nr:tRNA (adenosine(37)-N6)-dimethylallyltransferase MiaA [Candidatus Deferrimicrobium sp.]
MTNSLAAPEPAVIPIICGPTASGKTAIAIKLAESFPIQIISADSRQIIKWLDIGTAKPTPQERQRVQFHLIDLIEPGERYTAFRFMEDANRAIARVLNEGSIPVVVGGSGLYLRALSEGIVEIGDADQSVRQRLQFETQEQGAEAMYARLMEIDPVAAAGIHPNNKVRVLRALEIYYVTGKSKSELAAAGPFRKSQYNFEFFCLLPEREVLYRAVEQRVDRMMQSGLVSEVEDLTRRGLAERIRQSNVIGYNETLDHLQNKSTLPEAIRLIKQHSRQYAKRQITWFCRQVKGSWFSEPENLIGHMEKLLKNWLVHHKKT